MSYDTVREQDPAVADALEGERARQNGTLAMIASENHASPAVMEAQRSELTNKYAEGYPGERYYGGCAHADTVEAALEEAGVVLNANTVPGETRSAFNPSGIRAGTPALTTRGFTESACREVADLIADVVDAPDDEAVVDRVSRRVDELTGEYTLYD